MKLLAFLLASLAATAMADQGYLSVSKVSSGSDLDLSDATAADRTITAVLTDTGVATTGNASYSKWRIVLSHTFGAATTITAQFTCSVDGTTYGRRLSTSTDAGASTLSAESGTYPTGSASTTPMLEYDVRGCRAAKVLLGGANANSSDLVDWSWVATAGS